ncbi:hypothetical protein SG0102_21680 [Intestinibaculum porci]|uniref:Uncharacterized protein n=1 Tax=Intestinibaculum porci TaxID=2487118 RepID=A0A3G9JWQ9_9FIRM|nr:hypothetical protein [Intestinibaculum porci]BBH27234.1 hypothetical protein SG0102_21680 [Intestinibaculum porci]
MTKEELLTCIEKTKDADSCCEELKEACEHYLTAVGTADEKTAAKALIKEAQEDVCSIDDYLGFVGSDAAKNIFGDALPGMIEAGQKAKAAGEKHCLCDACQNGAKIIAYQDLLK